MWTKMIGIFGGLLLLAACSSAPETAPGGPPGGAGGPGMGGPGGIGSRNALPGSQQDLEASAGDRVFFAFDRSDISPEVSADPGAASRLAAALSERDGDDRRTLRRARHARVQPRARRAPRPGCQECLGRVGHSGIPDLDDQLRQGASCRRRVERRSLCAEPARRDHRELKTEPRRHLLGPIAAAVSEYNHADRGARPFFALKGP